MKIFKDNEGEVRSGWKIAIMLLIQYIFILIATFIIIRVIMLPMLIGIQMNSGEFFGGDSIEDKIMLVAMFSQEIIMILTPIFCWKIIFKKDLTLIGLKALNKKEVKNLSTGLIMGIIAITLTFILMIVTKSGSLVGFVLEPNMIVKLILYCILFIFVGFAEELVSRGYIMGCMEASGNKKILCILVSAVLFSLFHYGNNGFSFMPFLNIFLVGILFGIMYVETKSIWLSTGYHITWNFFQGCVYGMPVSGIDTPKIFEMISNGNSILNGGTFGPEGGLIVTLVTILMIVSLKFVIRNKKIQ